MGGWGKGGGWGGSLEWTNLIESFLPLRLLIWAWNFHFICFEKFRVGGGGWCTYDYSVSLSPNIWIMTFDLDLDLDLGLTISKISALKSLRRVGGWSYDYNVSLSPNLWTIHLKFLIQTWTLDFGLTIMCEHLKKVLVKMSPKIK